MRPGGVPALMFSVVFVGLIPGVAAAQHAGMKVGPAISSVAFSPFYGRRKALQVFESIDGRWAHPTRTSRGPRLANSGP